MSVGTVTTRARVGQYAALLAYVAFLGFPLLWLVATAFKSTQEIALGASGFLPEAPTLQNFGDAIRRADLVEAGWNSLRVAVASTILTTALAMPAAYGLARFKTFLRPVTLGWVLVSQVFPTILIIVPLFLILKQFDLVNNLVGLTIVYVVFTLPFALWMLIGFVANIPRELEEAAAVDGAGRLRILVSIVFPLLAHSSARTSGAFGRGDDRFVEEVYAAHTVEGLLAGYARAGDLPVRLFLAVGEDEWRNPLPEDARHDLDRVAAAVHDRARRAAGVSSRLVVLPGGHGWDVWEPAFAAGLPDLLAALAPGCAGAERH